MKRIEALAKGMKAAATKSTIAGINSSVNLARLSLEAEKEQAESELENLFGKLVDSAECKDALSAILEKMTEIELIEGEIRNCAKIAAKLEEDIEVAE